jgi:hypothetical protein
MEMQGITATPTAAYLIVTDFKMYHHIIQLVMSE